MDADHFLILPQDSDEHAFNRFEGHSEPVPSGAGAYSSSEDDELYIERLQALYEKQLGEVQAFARRERRNYEDVQRSIAQWYSKTLFDSTSGSSSQEAYPADREAKLSTIMRMISDALESLQVVSGHHSFFLVVNPNDEADKGFLGGTTLGREFWRGHRGCGLAGAQAFKLFCQKATNPNFSTLNVTQVLQQPQSDAASSVGVFPYPANVSTTIVTKPHSNVPKKNQASVIKAEVYASIRNAIRSVTGRRNAEMKWSNHDRLVDAYGVRLEGWPPSIPKQNPSTLSVAQNKAILEALQRGSMRFIPVNSTAQVPGNRNVEDLDAKARDEQDIFEDAVDFSAGFGEDGVFEDSRGKTGSGTGFVVNHSSSVNERLSEFTVQQSQDPMSSNLPVSVDTAGRGDGSNDTSFESTSHPMPADAQVHDDEDGIGTRKKRRMDKTGDNDV